ncbi:hypothetical protein BK139_07680 [Paenibacillus sp. FSL R5-0490]|uniref:DUF6612 family protein n=1 Tax=Bacillales TaxID=1385 RepID=UPI00096CA2A8|nr:DUF6612 family protein [Paenibacillus sp. FSL R5-0490]OMF61231.1 hypothetical protein BK139_07680 [Paenibacillus sp. FSL R5-0490]
MKKWLVGFVVAGVILVLGACNKELSKEEVIAGLEEHASEVENYHADIEIGVDIIDKSLDSTLQSSEAILRTDVNEKNMEGYGVVMGSANGSSTNSEYYFTKDKAYINANNQGWQKVPNQDQIRQDDTFYKNVVKIVTLIADKVEMTKQDDSYVFTFKGKDIDVYRAFEDPYSVSFTGIEQEEVEHDVKIVINAETFYIEELSNTLTGEKDNTAVIIDINHVYKNMNEMDKIEVPKEIIEEAALYKKGSKNLSWNLFLLLSLYMPKLHPKKTWYSISSTKFF